MQYYPLHPVCSINPILIRTDMFCKSETRATKQVVKQLEKRGYLSANFPFNYIKEADFLPREFTYLDKTYYIEYVSGCFYPYLMEITLNNKAVDITHYKNYQDFVAKYIDPKRN